MAVATQSCGLMMRLTNDPRRRSLKRGFAVALLMSGVLFCATGPVAGQTVSETVGQFFPESLAEPNSDAGEPVVRHQCLQVLTTDPSGSPETIFATYTNGYRAVVRVLRKSAGGFQVVAEPSGLHLWGLHCSIELADLGPVQQRVVHLSFEGAANTVNWLFAWNGQDLSNLTPLADTDFGSPESQLRNADLVDLDGDGTLDIVSQAHSAGGDPAPPTKVFRWSSGQYVADQR